MWQSVSACLFVLVLIPIAFLGAAGARASTGDRAANQPPPATLGGRGVAPMKGMVDLSKTPTITHGVQAGATPPHRHPDRMTPQERAIYEANARKGIGVPQAKATAQRPGSTRNASFVGGNTLPLVTKNVDGMNSTLFLDFVAPPDQALATDLGYVMEGVNNAVAIYRASTGALAYGPYYTSDFFAPVRQGNDTFSDPQMNYDVMRDRWIVSWLEITPANLTYLDIAVSASNSPTQPTPGGQYREYQIPTTVMGPNTWCDYDTLGIEYYSLTITCAMFNTSRAFLGNAVFVFNKASMLSGATVNYWWWTNYVTTDINSCGGYCAAYRLSPAIEEGVPDAEFIVATDAGYGGTRSNLTVCALTNLSNVSTTQPTLTCAFNNIGVAYADPIGAAQPGGSGANDPGIGTKQVYFKAGRLYVAFTSVFAGPGDGIVWAEIQPQLQLRSAHNPQWVGAALVTQSSTWYYNAGTYAYMPTLMGSDEDDMTLVFNFSTGVDFFPSIFYTGRKVTDPLRTMGQGATSIIVGGTHDNTSGRWGDYSACAVPLNSVTRGTIWCAGEYTGSNLWNTRLYALRVE